MRSSEPVKSYRGAPAEDLRKPARSSPRSRRILVSAARVAGGVPPRRCTNVVETAVVGEHLDAPTM